MEVARLKKELEEVNVKWKEEFQEMGEERSRAARKKADRPFWYRRRQALLSQITGMANKCASVLLLLAHRLTRKRCVFFTLAQSKA